jgi:hypothetical protein
MEIPVRTSPAAPLPGLPGDRVRQVMWRFEDRPALQGFVEWLRHLARGPIASWVASGGRRAMPGSEGRESLRARLDEAGLWPVMPVPFGDGSEHLAAALMAFELGWVDASVAMDVLAANQALAPIGEWGTRDQRARYLRAPAGSTSSEGHPALAGACCLEPGGTVRVAAWDPGAQPWLQVDKQARFVAGLDEATFVIVMVTPDDVRMNERCLVILEQADPGLFERGAAARAVGGAMASLRHPRFDLRVPASRILGGYDVTDGVIVPRYREYELVEGVVRRQRIASGAKMGARLLSAVEPVLRHLRTSAGHGGSAGPAGYALPSDPYDDSLQRLVEVAAAGEAGSSLAFRAARALDDLEAPGREKDRLFAARGVARGAGQAKILARLQEEAVELLTLAAQPDTRRDHERLRTLEADRLIQFVLMDAVADVLAPACRLWSAVRGGGMIREVMSLIGSDGVTEDGPGLLGYKWIDTAMEATLDESEDTVRRHLADAMTEAVFLAQFRTWIAEMREIASDRPGTGACTLASAMELWLWSLAHLARRAEADGEIVSGGVLDAATLALADALSSLLAARCQVLDVVELDRRAGALGAEADLAGFVPFLSDLCHVESARAAGEVGRIAAEVVCGSNPHPSWQVEGCTACYRADDVEALEDLFPGIASGARVYSDVIESDGSHPAKAGPCARFVGLESFTRLRVKLDGCLAGARLARSHAAAALATAPIPDVLDYPSRW